MRYAVWNAVSTEAQAAEEKASLPAQLAACRAFAATRGWHETAVYTVPGETRTGWVNLRDAEAAIPALRAMLDDARDHRFDILILYDYNRLRDLLDPVTRSLSAYGVQVYSLSQPVEPVDPARYNPYDSDAAAMMQGIAGIISKTQIADLRRKYNTAMPRRIQRGLPHKIPYGYQKPPGKELDRNAIPVINPAQASVLIRAKDAVLAGMSLSEVARQFTAQGIPSPSGGRWWVEVLATMLRDPFYCGTIRWRIKKITTDPRTGARHVTRNDPARVITAPGLHQPLWDESTHRALTRETARPRSYKGNRANQLTGLLRCPDCDAPMHVTYSSHAYKKEQRPAQHDIIWVCSRRKLEKGHPRIRHELLLQRLAARLAADAAQQRSHPQPAPANNAPALAEIAARRARLVEAYEAGILPLTDFQPRLAALEDARRTLEDAQRAAQSETEQHQARQAALEYIAAHAADLPAFLRDNDPRLTNHLLRALIRTITPTPTDVIIQYK